MSRQARVNGYRAREPERVARFAAAEAVRWLECGANSFLQTLLGSTLVLLGTAISRTSW